MSFQQYRTRDTQHSLWGLSPIPTSLATKNRNVHWVGPTLPSLLQGPQESCGPKLTEELREGIPPAEELPEDVVGAAEGEGEFGDSCAGS